MFVIAAITPAVAKDPPGYRCAADSSESGAESGKAACAPVANLPDAHGRTFATLDAYLAHLRSHAAPVDRPWWREVRPGVFRRETTMRGGKPERLWTRVELDRRFGFSK